MIDYLENRPERETADKPLDRTKALWISRGLNEGRVVQDRLSGFVKADDI